MAAFMDFHVKHCDEQLLGEKLLKAEHLGYEVVAIDFFLDELHKPKQKGQKKPVQPVITPANEIKLPPEKLKNLKWKRKAPRQLTRFSTVVKDLSQTHKLTSEVVQGYDLLAVAPSCDKTFQQACKTLDIDIITIDVTQRLPYYIKRHAVNVALQRGLFFELQYSCSLHDEGIRKRMISNGIELISICKGKNVIITSACEKPIDLRGPYDVANLGLMFGMTEAQGKAAVSQNCRALLFHAESRKVLKSVIWARKLPSLGDTEDSESHPQILIKSENKKSEKNEQSSVNSNTDNDGHERTKKEDHSDLDEPPSKRLKVTNS